MERKHDLLSIDCRAVMDSLHKVVLIHAGLLPEVRQVSHGVVLPWGAYLQIKLEGEGGGVAGGKGGGQLGQNVGL